MIHQNINMDNVQIGNTSIGNCIYIFFLLLFFFQFAPRIIRINKAWRSKWSWYLVVRLRLLVLLIDVVRRARMVRRRWKCGWGGSLVRNSKKCNKYYKYDVNKYWTRVAKHELHDQVRRQRINWLLLRFPLDDSFVWIKLAFNIIITVTLLYVLFWASRNTHNYNLLQILLRRDNNNTSSFILQAVFYIKYNSLSFRSRNLYFWIWNLSMTWGTN